MVKVINAFPLVAAGIKELDCLANGLGGIESDEEWSNSQVDFSGGIWEMKFQIGLNVRKGIGGQFMPLRVASD